MGNLAEDYAGLGGRTRLALPDPRGVRRLPREESMRLNISELRERKSALTAPPRLLTLGTHNSCNAKCVFCLEGRYVRSSLRLYKSFFEGKMGHFIRQAEKVTFTGFGEVLWLPDTREFLDYLNETIPETWKIFTTNGTPLRPFVLERLLKSKYVIQASLHASHAELHRELTLLGEGAFDRIIESLRVLCVRRRELGIEERLHVVSVNVLTRRNVSDLPKMIQLAWDLKVPEFQCSYVTMFAPEHIEQSCFFEPLPANRAIAAAEEKLAEIEKGAAPGEFRFFRVGLPQRFGQPRREAESDSVCKDPWENIYVEGQGSVLPCCFWGTHIGNLNKGEDIDAVWNGEFYRGLRASMASQKPHPWCGSCVKHRGFNVDSLLCHVTNRPDQQRRLLAEIERRGLIDTAPYLHAVEAAERAAPR